MARWFLPNTGFELGNRYWDSVTGFSIIEDAVNARSGRWVGRIIDTDISVRLPSVNVRPGAIIDASMWIKGGTEGIGQLSLAWLDAGGSAVAFANSNNIAAGGAIYAQTSAVFTAPDRTKFFTIGLQAADIGSGVAGTWYFDDLDASGDIIESIPASAIIESSRMITAETVAAFEPLVGSTKFTEFNSGMSDRWSGVYTFVPALGADLGELVSFMRRIGKRERFFAYDADRTTPVNGVVNGMVVDGSANGGNTRIPVRGGPVDTTALLAGDYVEIRAQYFQVQRALEIGPEGTGDLIVWPAVRASLADGEDVITDNPKMVARMTSELDWRRVEAHPVGPLSMSWEEWV